MFINQLFLKLLQKNYWLRFSVQQNRAKRFDSTYDLRLKFEISISNTANLKLFTLNFMKITRVA